MKIKFLISKLLEKTVFKRRLFFFFGDTILISFSMYIAFWCRFNGRIPSGYKEIIPFYIVIAIGIKLMMLVLYNLYDISWRFVSLETLLNVFKATTIGSLLLGASLFIGRFTWFFKQAPFPRSVLLIDYVISLCFIGFLRAAKRLYFDGFKGSLKSRDGKWKVLIIGAGSAGEQIVREMKRKSNSPYIPLGFIDDDPAKQKIRIHGVKVLGTREDLPKIIKDNSIDEILIAMPSVDSKNIREIINIIRQSKPLEKVKILPGVTDLIDGRVTLTDIKKVRVEDLLGRRPVTINYEKINRFMKGKDVLITGAGGSIGSELVKIALSFNPNTIIALDIDETELFYLINKLDDKDRIIVPVVGDIRDEVRIREVFLRFSPQIILHAAAYKHVPLLEFNPEEAVKTNIYGTKVLAELALEYEVEKFVFISTDKAINPTSVMGASKRCSEEMLRVMNQQQKTKFISVRFGNVLGSRGSVIPLFEEQIKRKGPVTVTHPEMKRYFMVTSEAVLLVLEAAAIGSGGEVFVLDMGEPVKILDLACEMIRLSGYQPDVDIPIVFTGIRPGEKLFEEILSAEEGTEATENEKIFVARNSNLPDSDKLLNKINKLIRISFNNGGENKIKGLLKEIVPTYNPELGFLGGRKVV